MKRPPASDPPAARVLGAARAWALAWLVVALSNGVAIALLPMPARVGTRLAHHAFDFLHMVAIAAAGVAVIALFGRLVGGRRRGSLVKLVALSLLSLAIAGWALVPDFEGWAERMGRPWLAYAGAAFASLSLPAAVNLGRVFDAPFRRLAAVALALGVLVAHHLLIPGAYPGIHLYWLWSATALVARALAGAPLPLVSARLLPNRRALRLVGGGLAGAGALGSLVLWPSPVVVSQVFQVSGSVLFPFLAGFHVQADGEDFSNDRTSARFVDKEWLEPRDRLRSIAPSRPSLLPERPLIILLTIDALRVDVAGRLRKSGRFPNIDRLARESVEFTNARSPSSATRHTLSAIFTGRYASQLEWKGKKLVDSAPTFPSLLRRADIRTFHVASHPMIGRGWGITGRFDKTVLARKKPRGQKVPLARDTLPVAVAELDSVLAQPSFLYMHWLDPHFPYDSRGDEGTVLERHQREAETCDQVFGALREELEKRGVWERTVVILSSDHGEAFGDHGVFSHGDALYEVLVRVPMMIRVPGVKPASVDVPVSGIDIGPTVLDLAGVKTPATFLGQSLVPFLRGARPALTRPVAGDASAARSLVLGRYKIIDDRRKQTVELYDLVLDPKERSNIFGERSEDELMLKALHRFFDAHSNRRARDSRERIRSKGRARAERASNDDGKPNDDGRQL